MSDAPLLTIVIPVYNAENFIQACVRSCLEQDFQDGELQIVCVDDGSTDRSLQILEELAQSVPCLEVLHQENAGVSAARNTGMEQIRGKYFQFVDADDLLIAHTIRPIVQAMDAESCQVAQFKYMEGSDQVPYQTVSELCYRLGKMDLSGPVWLYLFSSRAFSRLRFDTRIKYGEDTLFAQTVFLHSPSCLTADLACYIHRDVPGSLMRSRDLKQSAASMLLISKVLKSYLDQDLFPSQKKMIEIWQSRTAAAYIVYLARSGDCSYPFTMLKAEGLWPCRKEWMLLVPRLSSKKMLRATVANFCMFFVQFRPAWWILSKLMAKAGL